MKFQRRHFIRKITTSLLFAFLLVAFQNCEPVTSNSDLGSINASKASGNGGTYDGKMWGRIVPGFSCQGVSSLYGSVRIADEIGTVYSGCNETEKVPVSEFEFSKFTSDYIGYKDGIYSFSENIQNEMDRGTFTEAWCQSISTLGSKEGEFEIAIRWENRGQEVLSRFFNSRTVPPIESKALRMLDIDKVNYSDAKSNLEIHFASRAPGSNKYPGTYYRDSIQGERQLFPVECRMGGQFDSIAPRLEYPESIKTWAVGSEIENMNPLTNKPIGHFSVIPSLPAGLNLNPLTGEISGTPQMLVARSTYLVTANFDFGTVSRAISIAVANEFNVDSVCSENVCKLSKLLDLANEQKPLPAIIHLNSPSILWPDRQFDILGDIELRGRGQIFDAHKMHRHFNVKAGASLSIQNLELRNGKAPQGGSIYVERNGLLHIDRSKFDSNESDASQDGKGGAIYVFGGSLSANQCSFTNNSTLNSGVSLSGGAIHVEYGKIVQISRSTFLRNSSPYGGGIAIQGNSGGISEIRDVQFIGNQASTAGGLYLYGGQTIVTDSVFESNDAVFDGGGLKSIWPDRVWIQGVQFRFNSAGRGSAVSYESFNSLSRLYLLDSTFSENFLNLFFLQYTSEIGSIINYSGAMLIKDSNFLSSQIRMLDCHQQFSSVAKSIRSMGTNHFNDQSCF